MENKTFFVTLEFTYEEIEVEAINEPAAIEEAKLVVRRGWITPSYTNTTVVKG